MRRRQFLGSLVALTYNEGPFRQWVAVSFPAGVALGRVVGVANGNSNRVKSQTGASCGVAETCDTSGTNDLVTITFSGVGLIPPSSPASLHGMTGVGQTSGKSYDLTTAPTLVCEITTSTTYEKSGSPCPDHWHSIGSAAAPPNAVETLTIRWNSPNANPGFALFELVDFS